jgi:hypothetical protein
MYSANRLWTLSFPYSNAGLAVLPPGENAENRFLAWWLLLALPLPLWE